MKKSKRNTTEQTQTPNKSKGRHCNTGVSLFRLNSAEVTLNNYTYLPTYLPRLSYRPTGSTDRVHFCDTPCNEASSSPSSCLSVCLSVTLMDCTQTAEQIELYYVTIVSFAICHNVLHIRRDPQMGWQFVPHCIDGVQVCRRTEHCA